jgi:hypothetical protein
MGGSVKVESEGKDKGTQFIIAMIAICKVRLSDLNVGEDE